MPNLKPVPRVIASKGKHRRRRGRRRRTTWWEVVKIAFLVEQFRRRRSSPSIRQIALVVVSGGLAIMVIRVLSRRKRQGAGVQEETAQPDRRPRPPARTAQPETAQPETAQPETAQPETVPAETAQPETQDESRDAPSTDPTPGNDTVAVNEDSLTDRVQSEMSDRANAPTPGTGAD